ncbi:uncharacterized protein BT62DRAFT_931496 [Guyanagaster necrorhizus]|uniref:Uncharacterized protein n=1 Tax=Guyanagaster necrorhizus TaxID=856835 RepID=A0A9P7VUQ2_9AGAR|nr:uncharacterized protein BT62DRAFT_931496 [Guyanagaster necrorhizus MCA 3950]KAG7446922.1 hypothetical protein BT62DRAFT_931496 [Guyanagaster necrorhizus MCA 3950]
MSEPVLYATILDAPNFPFDDQHKEFVGMADRGNTLEVRLDLNLEVVIAIKAKVEGDITLSLQPVIFCG